MANIKYYVQLSASLLLLGAISFATQAQAEDEDVTVRFSGTIASTCSFGPPTDGVLAKSGTLAAIEGSAGVDGLSTGNAGQVSVECSNGGQLIVATVEDFQQPGAFQPKIVQAIVQRGNNTASSDFTSMNTGGPFGSRVWRDRSSTAPLQLPTGLSELNVAMIAGDDVDGTLPSGDYDYRVTLTVTPN